MKHLNWSKFSRWLRRWQPIEGSFVSSQGTLCTLATSRKPVSHHVTDSSLCHRFPQWSDKDKDMDWDKDNDKTLDNHRTNYFAASRGCCPHSFVCLVFLDAGWSKLWKPGKRSLWFWGGCLKSLSCWFLGSWRAWMSENCGPPTHLGLLYFTHVSQGESLHPSFSPFHTSSFHQNCSIFELVKMILEQHLVVREKDGWAGRGKNFDVVNKAGSKSTVERIK